MSSPSGLKLILGNALPNLKPSERPSSISPATCSIDPLVAKVQQLRAEKPNVATAIESLIDHYLARR